MSKTPMQELAEFGQSLWLDYIDRPLLETDKLDNLISNGLRGMTSNPSIFNNAIGSSNDYDQEIIRLKSEGKSTFEIYDALTVKDIQQACDKFAGVYESTNGLDGYVSLEINPQLANSTAESIAEGMRLYKSVGRPNVMIKVPSTDPGFPVIEELISQGINVNVTLIFSKDQYEKTVAAYFNGLKRLAEAGGDLSKVRSVASVFVSRIDAAVDKLIDAKIGMNDDASCRSQLEGCRGQAAVCNARKIYESFKELHSSDTFHGLFDKGANEQRVLWASTGTKNPDYSDIKYVTELISKPTVNTLPEKTLNAFIDHGKVDAAFTENIDQVDHTLDVLDSFGISVDDVCAQLLEQGVGAFNDAFKELFESLETKSAQLTVN